MDAERRQHLNLLAIRVSIASAMRGLRPEEAARTLRRANMLLDQARRVATSDTIRDEIEALQRDLDARYGSQSGENETSG